MVRNAIDQDAGGSQFGNKLDTLNDQLAIYKSVFYKKKPSFELNFIQRQKDALLKEKTKKLSSRRRGNVMSRFIG